MKSQSDEPLSGMPIMEILPPPNTKRWVVRRKAAVVAAVRTGGITIEEACRVYQLSEEEFLAWVRAFEIHGLAGLRATRVQQHRASRAERAPLSISETAD
jgi:transposase-like protein